MFQTLSKGYKQMTEVSTSELTHKGVNKNCYGIAGLLAHLIDFFSYILPEVLLSIIMQQK